ncbi:MAG: DUF58 domain-containing protein [Microthrixaceae bacterium]|nr:DUF58 domain-containing protein [Microthrixaceae bacterium]
MVAAVCSLAFLAYPGTAVNPFLGAAVVTALVLVVAAADALVGTAPGLFEIQRRHPPVVVAGREAELRWTVRSGAARRVVLEVADSPAPSLRARSRRFRVVIPRNSVANVTTTFEPMRRGHFVLDRVALRIHGRLGLGARQREVPLRTELRVHPPFRSAREAELRIRRARILEVGTRSARGLGGGTEFEQLREYGPDDEFRRIDWTATARVGKPVVRTYRAERNQRVLVLLDNGRVMAGRVGGVPRVEHAMDAAMMLTAVATRLGDRCGMVAFDTEVRSVVPPARRSDQLARVTEAMYALEPALSESDYSGAFTEVVSRFRRRAMLVVVSDLLEQAVTDSLVPALPLITRTHLVVVAGVTDPAVDAWARGPVADDDEVFRRVAAVRALQTRRRAAAQLSALGAIVIDAPPGRLAVDLADAYLQVKTTGRL